MMLYHIKSRNNRAVLIVKTLLTYCVTKLINVHCYLGDDFIIVTVYVFLP